jgi:hypothetical protein
MKTTENERSRAPRAVPKAIRFASGPPNQPGGFAKSMFQEDLYSGIAPYPWRRGGNEFISVTGNDDDREKVSTLFASLGRGRAFPVERSVADAIEIIGVQIVHYGAAVFEKLGGSKDVPLTLSSFSPEHVWRVPGLFIQVVPRTAWGYAERKYAVIRSRDVWRLKLPRQLGSVRGYRAMIRQLSTWSPLGPRFLQSELEKRRFPEDFSVGDYSRLLRVHQYQVTRELGWTARDWSLDYVTEFYQFYRLTTFKWAQAVLREHIVSELNSFLSRQGLTARIELQNVILASAILEVRQRLKQGTLDFAGVNKALEGKI